ncbi:MAG: hypothetical protein NTZ09_21005 [Candidatus Hydrogenedentes bacterium]|nr:hypothetical protein [Candidatus Hydrogenedentota bacterium]
MRIFKLLFPPLVLSLVVAILVIPSSGFYIKPYLNNITPDGVTIMWETGAVTDGAIDYGVPGAPPSSATETQPSKIHKIRITGLMPDTVYAYKVRSGPEDTFEATFKTAPTDQRPIAFAVIGDSRRWGDRWQETEMSRHMR